MADDARCAGVGPGVGGDFTSRPNRGVLSAFWLDGASLKPVGEVRAPHAHTVSVDPRTHRVYLPLENINGHPVLRIYEPMQ